MLLFFSWDIILSFNYILSISFFFLLLCIYSYFSLDTHTNPLTCFFLCDIHYDLRIKFLYSFPLKFTIFSESQKTVHYAWANLLLISFIVVSNEWSFLPRCILEICSGIVNFFFNIWFLMNHNKNIRENSAFTWTGY